MNKRLGPIIFDHTGKMDIRYNILKTIFPHSQFSSLSCDSNYEYFYVEASARSQNPGFPFACRNPLAVDDQLKLHHNISYVPDYDVELVFGVSFGGSGAPGVLLGEFHQPDDYTKYFVPADTYEQSLAATHVIVRTNWDRSHPNTAGHLADLINPDAFYRNSDNSGFRGSEFWVMPFTMAKCDAAFLQSFRLRHASYLPTAAQALLNLERFIGHTLMSYAAADPEQAVGHMFLLNQL